MEQKASEQNGFISSLQRFFVVLKRTNTKLFCHAPTKQTNPPKYGVFSSLYAGKMLDVLFLQGSVFPGTESVTNEMEFYGRCPRQLQSLVPTAVPAPLGGDRYPCSASPLLTPLVCSRGRKWPARRGSRSTFLCCSSPPRSPAALRVQHKPGCKPWMLQSFSPAVRCQTHMLPCGGPWHLPLRISFILWTPEPFPGSSKSSQASISKVSSACFWQGLESPSWTPGPLCEGWGVGVEGGCWQTCLLAVSLQFSIPFEQRKDAVGKSLWNGVHLVF